MLVADHKGNIYEHPELMMLYRSGWRFSLPRPDELMPLPPESELLLLPGRRAIGLDPHSGRVAAVEENAVAAFVAPGHTLTGLAAYQSEPGRPVLPMFAYAAAGFAKGRFWVCARKVDQDQRQVFVGIAPARIQAGASDWLRRFPSNRLVRHLVNCALNSKCPAARNLCLGRFEAPLPTARSCNARCLGCLSLQSGDSGFPSTQKRLNFEPSVKELVEIMLRHSELEPRPLFSFGQGCEGEPLSEAAVIGQAITEYRAKGGRGGINMNTNASRPHLLPTLAQAGLNSVRVSLNSARAALYERYYRPVDYCFADVENFMALARELGLFVSLNYFVFPGITDTEAELERLLVLLKRARVDFIQLRNLNLDPELYLEKVCAGEDHGPVLGTNNFLKRLGRECPWLGFGYFNPYRGTGASGPYLANL